MTAAAAAAAAAAAVGHLTCVMGNVKLQVPLAAITDWFTELLN